jgi:hypothetical protein
MKRISVLALALLSVSLAQPDVAQSTPPTTPATTTKGQAKQNKQAAKAQAKAKKDDAKAQNAKKPITSQDAAYAAAYAAGIPK